MNADTTLNLPPGVVNDRRPNWRNTAGQLYLVRCFACDADHGRENYAMSVSSGECAWCGWSDARNTHNQPTQ